MICPRCSTEAVDGAVDCPSCGVIFSKWRTSRPDGSVRESDAAPRQVRTVPQPSRENAATSVGPLRKEPPEYLGVAQAGWQAAGLGLMLAVILPFFPFLSFILHPISTLVHEIGHTVMYWLFGYQAIPAFDFANGESIRDRFASEVRHGAFDAEWKQGRATAYAIVRRGLS